MIFTTVEFCLFFILFLSIFFLTRTNKIVIISIFNTLFYGFFSYQALIYLIFYSFLLYIYPKIKNYKKFIITLGFSILQIFFWKFYELDFFKIENLIIPVGISFFTFQGMTYLFGLEKIPKNKEHLYILEPWNFLKIYSFIGFFPTIFSGPILRAKHWENQLIKKEEFNAKNFNIAIFYILIGCFYKLVLSSYLHNYVSLAFSSPKNTDFLTLWLGMYSYGLEIFFDFAGYSLMAIGISKLFFFNLDKNFDAPYLSKNLQEFWTKWHISLSSWFKDYVYIPLGGNQKGKLIQNRNIVLVMFLSGVWHAIALQYLVWAFLHIIGIVFIHNTRFIINKFLSIFINIHYVFFAWIFFRSENFSLAKEYICNMFNFSTSFSIDIKWIVLIIISFIFIFIESKILNFKLVENNSYKTNIIWAALFIFILMLSPSGLPPFIYFKY